MSENMTWRVKVMRTGPGLVLIILLYVRLEEQMNMSLTQTAEMTNDV